MSDRKINPIPQESTKDSTNSLRGFAIVFVLANHFLNQYVDPSFRGFANAVISIFFILSGYGIAHSLERHPKETVRTRHPFFHFYIDRIVRIYPLFILSLLLEGWISNLTFSPLAYLGNKSPGHYRFVNQIIHCYLVAPLIYSFLLKTSIKRFLLTGILLFAVLNTSFLLTPFHQSGFVRYLLKSSLGYRDLFLMHPLLFSLGMAIFKFQQGKHLLNQTPMVWWKAILAISILPVLFFFWKTGPFPYLRTGSDILFLLSCVYVCHVFITYRLRIPYLNISASIHIHSIFFTSSIIGH